MLMDTANAKSFGEESDGMFGDLPGWVAPSVVLLLVLLIIMGMIVLNRAEGAIEVESIDWTKSDDDIDAVVDDAELVE